MCSLSRGMHGLDRSDAGSGLNDWHDGTKANGKFKIIISSAFIFAVVFALFGIWCPHALAQEQDPVTASLCVRWSDVLGGTEKCATSGDVAGVLTIKLVIKSTAPAMVFDPG